eukprot:scpid101591/ scgid2531/ Receptor-type tyrosine-protein phosphatase eta; HPTP eta; Protein-tyrosine phosphatase receptor type J; Supporting-cell antigen
MGMLESDRCYHFVFLHPYPFPGPPSALANLQLLENGMDKVKLLWSVTRDAYPATRLIFLLSLAGGVDVRNEVIPITGTSGEHVLKNLMSQTAYIVRVYASNNFGLSAEAKEQVIRTRGTPSPLTELRLSENGTDRVKLFWQVNLTSDEYPATRLMFSLKLESGADVRNITTNITENSGEQTLDNLVPQTAYIVSVYTVNTFGESEVARELSFHTHGPPSPLTDLQLTRNGTDTVSLFWRVDMTDGFPATQLMFVL